MSEQTLYLFPDTNVFIQCKPLEQLDWSEWQHFSEVHLLVSRPVQREIDDQKNRGNSRVAKRARTTYRLFRRIIDGRQDYELIRSSNPVVKLHLEGPSRPSPELADILDYSKEDDQIVGCLHKFRQVNQGTDARLLTYDGGPIMTANSLEIPYVAVREDWLLPPENNQLERENAHLRERVAQLERSEPRFKVELVDDRGAALDRLELEHLVYDPLPNETIESLMDRLTTRFPKATDFGSREANPRHHKSTVLDLMVPRQVYVPAKDEEIDQYSNRDYPKWVRECREVLTNLYEELQIEAGEPEFTFAISNVGNRPGNSALVNIEAKGSLRIFVAEYIPDTESPHSMDSALPSPPTPPIGRWSSFQHELRRSMTLPNLLRDPFRIPSILPLADKRRDPNAFFYKPNRPTTPSDSITLECEQWRHSTGSEHFSGLISIASTAEEIRGALVCQVHAENLSKPVCKLIPVRIAITRTSSEGHAKDLVEKLRFGPRKRG